MYLYAEWRYAQLFRIVNKVSDGLTNLNVNSPSRARSDSYVYLCADSILYPRYFDSEFSIGITGAVVSREVEYCQWVEKGFDSTDRQTRTRRYMRTWTREFVNSSDFMDTRYQNSANFPFGNFRVQQKVTVGSIIIDDRLFTDVQDMEYCLPTPEDLQAFAHSEGYQSAVRYLGNGYFFFSGNVSLPVTLNSPCNPGDVKIRFKYFAPDQLSVLGYLRDSVISTSVMDGMPIGGVGQGKISVATLLSSQHADKRKFAVIARSVAVLSAIVLILDHSTTVMGEIWNFGMFGLLVLWVRAIVWHHWLLNPWYCGLILLVCTSVYTTRDEQYVTFD
jgi:hypothetical protein